MTIKTRQRAAKGRRRATRAQLVQASALARVRRLAGLSGWTPSAEVLRKLGHVRFWVSEIEAGEAIDALVSRGGVERDGEWLRLVAPE